MSTLAEDYLEGYGGSVATYHSCLTHGQRIGQAFFNALSQDDRDYLTGSLADPFYRDLSSAIERAVEALLYRK